MENMIVMFRRACAHEDDEYSRLKAASENAENKSDDASSLQQVDIVKDHTSDKDLQRNKKQMKGMVTKEITTD